MTPKVYEALETSNPAAAQKQLRALMAKAKRAGVKATSVLLEGLPADQIVRRSSRRADVIVIGTHGHTESRQVLPRERRARAGRARTVPLLTVRGK